VLKRFQGKMVKVTARSSFDPSAGSGQAELRMTLGGVVDGSSFDRLRMTIRAQDDNTRGVVDGSSFDRLRMTIRARDDNTGGVVDGSSFDRLRMTIGAQDDNRGSG
jgi:hypothetical protein